MTALIDEMRRLIESSRGSLDQNFLYDAWKRVNLEHPEDLPEAP